MLSLHFTQSNIIMLLRQTTPTSANNDIEGRFWLLPTITVTNPLGQVFVMQSGAVATSNLINPHHHHIDNPLQCATMDEDKKQHCYHSAEFKRFTCATASLVLAILVVSLPLLILRHSGFTAFSRKICVLPPFFFVHLQVSIVKRTLTNVQLILVIMTPLA